MIRRRYFSIRGSLVNVAPNDPPKFLGAVFPDARCAEPDVDPDWWFEKEGSSAEKVAVAFCNQCPAQADCLAYAVTEDIKEGTWGGLNGRELRLAIYRHQTKGHRQ